MQRSLRIAKAELGNEDYEYISISTDIGFSDAKLLEYADTQGFDWTFVNAPPEFVQSLVAEFGRSIITTPNMPHFVIQPDGSIQQMFDGAISPVLLIEQIRRASAI